MFDDVEEDKVQTTNLPYERKVAEVISRAGKYFPGVCLLQEELAKGALPLAQIGTVEVYAIGPIEVGELLTISTEPGYAMAVKDPTSAFGSVIGKATRSLKVGEKGLVEMQVEKH